MIGSGATRVAEEDKRMKSAISVFILLFTLSVAATPSFAQGRGKGQGQGGGPKATSPKSTGGGKKAADTVRPKPADATHARSEPKAPKVAKEPKAPKELKTPKAHATKTAPVTTGPIDPITPTTPITRNVKNPRLESRLLAMLPAGTTIQDASQGFKNWGQFVAAVHVSNNLNIPFADLKARMTGLTPGTVPGTVIPTAPLSLGQAIQSFKGTTVTPAPGTVPLSPTTIATEVKKAEDAANAELRRTRERS
jgi:hypothetical protein